MPTPTSAVRRPWQAKLIIALFAVAVAGAALLGWWYARESPPHQGPIVLVSVDALRADQLRAYGGNRTDTPAIDALAADSVVFERAYTHSPQTLPAHASILTGRLPFEHGVRDEAGFPLPDQARTIAELLRSRGFATGGAVSSLLLRRTSGVAQGFSFYDAELPPATDGQPSVARDGLTTFAAAEAWSRMQNGQRYFLFLEVDAAAADAVVSRLVEALRTNRLYDGATIVFTAGHGDPDSGATLDDTSLRVPLIVKQPGLEGAGRRITMAVQHIDLLPTLLDLVRAPVPSGLRGRSLRPILDDDTDLLPDQPIYAESLEARLRFGGRALFAVTAGGTRLVRGPAETLTRVVPAADAGSSPAPAPDAVSATLGAALDRFVGGQPAALPADVPAAELERLAAVGYLPAPRPAETPGADALTLQDQARFVRGYRAAARDVARGQIADAIAGLRTLSDRTPAPGAVWFTLGTLLAREARPTEAIAAFEKAAAALPDASDVAVHLTAALLRAHRVDAAVMQADRAVELTMAGSPGQKAAAHEAAARAALAAHDTDAATAHAAEAQRAVPDRPLPQLVQGLTLLEMGQYDGALEPLQQAGRLLDEHGDALADLHLALGDVLAKLERYPEAEAQYREELRAFPDNLRTWISLAGLYAASQRTDQVGTLIDELLRAAPTAEGYATAVRAWAAAGERVRSEQVRAEARRRFRGDSSLTLLN